ncbi:MAG: anhydro-N-acetylmuramic acid kinase [Flavobacteriales bacterium]|nr:anhydro-N-acetylmuramic acid kinase [Bacteroidota bacterium]MCB9240623.1 anhydro-N-acetylmuramic acid kinase [Flavobacteriales bacterium]
MSGTSMDGVDIAHCELTPSESGKWSYTINAAKTVSYSDTWRLRLSKLRNQTAMNVYKTDRYFGEYIGRLINAFLDEHQLEADLIASHGHTILHQPESNITYQVGSGSAISAVTGIPSVTNFRAMDVVKGGEGAPVSGIGDQLLFSEYTMGLNLGGFANISATVDGEPVAYDICPCNILLNRIAREFGKEYDENGEIAATGQIDYDLLADVNNIDYYTWSYPKSLGREWINENFWFRVRESEASKEDRMKTLVEHIGEQIGNNIEDLASDSSTTRVLVTGGGAFNPVLVEHIRSHTDAEIIVPDPMLVNYKEALIFALMGVLRVRNEVNVLASFTGANGDSVSGELCGDFSKLLA